MLMDKFDSNFTTEKYFFRPLNILYSEMDNFRFSSSNHNCIGIVLYCIGIVL